MPLQNRVDPTGHLVATASRGFMMGNRGKLHDEDQRIVRCHSGRINWLCCRLEFRGRHREIMHRRSYTELFFLDEATALAAGHRPCSECRHTPYLHFKGCWAAAHGLNAMPSAVEIDTALAASRQTDNGEQRTHHAHTSELPDGAIVDWDSGHWLLWQGKARRWTFDGYQESVPRTELPCEVVVRTPQATLAVLYSGYRPVMHHTLPLRTNLLRKLALRSSATAARDTRETAEPFSP